MFWDFLNQTPESVHQVSFLFSDRGTPYGFRHMHGYGSHTYKLVNEKGEQFFVKFHWVCDQPIKNFSAQEADQMKSKNPDFAQQDLFEAIERGEYPSWTLKIQLLPFEEGLKYKWNIFDVTKVWPHSEVPLFEVGKMTLNRNPKNYFAEVEQAAFSPAHMVLGIEPSQDKMLQGRLFSYPDTHRHRLGANYQQLPINCPYRTKIGISNGQRDGPMCFSNQENRPNYNPNTFQPFTFGMSTSSPYKVEGTATRHPQQHPNSDYEQVGNFYRKALNEKDRTALVSNIVNHLKHANKDIIQRQIAIFYKCDPEYGMRVAQGCGVDIKNSPKM